MVRLSLFPVRRRHMIGSVNASGWRGVFAGKSVYARKLNFTKDNDVGM